MFMSATSDDAANIAAINTYIMNATLQTSAAGNVRNEWLKWHDGLGWYSREYPSVEIYDQARNLRNKFNLANAKTPAEKEQVKRVMTGGITSEETRGETKRTTAEGTYLAPEPDEDSAPWIPTKTKVALGLSALVITGLMLAKSVYIDPILAPFRRR